MQALKPAERRSHPANCARSSGGCDQQNDWQLILSKNSSPPPPFSLLFHSFLDFRAADLHSSTHGKAEEQERSALGRWNALRDFTRKAAIRWFLNGDALYYWTTTECYLRRNGHLTTVLRVGIFTVQTSINGHTCLHWWRIAGRSVYPVDEFLKIFQRCFRYFFLHFGLH